MKSKLNLITISLWLLLLSANTSAEEIYLNNGDKISGEIIKQDKEAIIVKTRAMGNISIKTDFVKEIIPDQENRLAQTKKDTPELWKKEISFGYNESRGNTENSQLSFNLFANRKTEDNEFTARANTYYSSSDKTMDSQKWYTMLRYAYSFGARKWYNFYRLEADHDKFANIDHRIIPAAGLGYWYSDTPAWKAMTEAALGLEQTNFKQQTKDSDQLVLIPRAFLEAAVFENSKISQDISLYASLSDKGEYRLRSETVFENPINEKLLLRLSLINDYNSGAPETTKKSDLRLISSLAYSF